MCSIKKTYTSLSCMKLPALMCTPALSPAKSLCHEVLDHLPHVQSVTLGSWAACQRCKWLTRGSR